MRSVNGEERLNPAKVFKKRYVVTGFATTIPDYIIALALDTTFLL
jgi:hypothetical protein